MNRRGPASQGDATREAIGSKVPNSAVCIKVEHYAYYFQAEEQGPCGKWQRRVTAVSRPVKH